MTTPEFESHPSHHLLPVVSEETLQSVSANFLQTEDIEIKTLLLMEGENPHLAEGISRVITSLANGDTRRAQELSLVSGILYQCLRSQAEASAMNERLAE